MSLSLGRRLLDEIGHLSRPSGVDGEQVLS
jgi:hypothetical protein